MRATRVLGLLVASVLTFEVASIASADEFPPPPSDTLTVGPFTLVCHPDRSGVTVVCLGHLAAVLVAAHAITATVPDYTFDVAAGNATAKGHLTAQFLPPDQLSTMEADVVIQTTGQPPQIYRGAFTYWHTVGSASTKPSPAKPHATPRRAEPHTRPTIALRKTPGATP